MVYSVIQRNVFLACLHRKFSSVTNVRYFKIPLHNFDVKNYVELIDCQRNKLSEALLTKIITEEDIKYHIVQKSIITFEVFPRHTQEVEGIIKKVTDSSLKVCGYEARNGYIKLRLFTCQDITFFKVNLSSKYKQSKM